MGRERRCGRGRGDLQREPRVGPSVDPAATGDRVDRAAKANNVSVARLGGTGAATAGAERPGGGGFLSLRRDGPFKAIAYALCTRQSRTASAIVGSPRYGCH